MKKSLLVTLALSLVLVAAGCSKTTENTTEEVATEVEDATEAVEEDAAEAEDTAEADTAEADTAEAEAERPCETYRCKLVHAIVPPMLSVAAPPFSLYRAVVSISFLNITNLLKLMTEL